MTRTQLEELKNVLIKFVYDEQRNQRPEVVKALALVDIAILQRIRASKAMKESFWTPDNY